MFVFICVRVCVGDQEVCDPEHSGGCLYQGHHRCLRLPAVCSPQTVLQTLLLRLMCHPLQGTPLLLLFSCCCPHLELEDKVIAIMNILWLSLRQYSSILFKLFCSGPLKKWEGLMAWALVRIFFRTGKKSGFMESTVVAN